MSTCISRHGEYSDHTLDDEYECTRCHVLDEDALQAELHNVTRERDQARAELERLHGANVLIQCDDPDHAEVERLRGVAKALRITVAEMLSGKQHTHARTTTWQATLEHATEALNEAVDRADEIIAKRREAGMG